MDEYKPYFPIPGYEGSYWINAEGDIVNKAQHPLKKTKTDKGDVVELRKYGQREKYLVSELLTKTLEVNT